MRWLNWEIIFKTDMYKYTQSLVCVYNVYVICVCMMHAHVCMWIRAFQWPSLSFYLPLLFTPGLFIVVCSLLAVYAKLADLWASKYLPSLLSMKHKSQGYKPVLPCLALCMFYLVNFKSSLWDIKHFIHWAISLGCTCTIAKINNGQYLLFMPDFCLIDTYANREKNKTYLYFMDTKYVMDVFFQILSKLNHEIGCWN